MLEYSKKIVLPGGAGLVGQNLVARLKERGYRDIIVLDKHRSNIRVLKDIHPDVTAEYADLAISGCWERHFKHADVVVMLQAQIGGNDYSQFERNNIDSTSLVLEAIKSNGVPYLVHISSSVVKSVADDFYTNTKKKQEMMVLESGISCSVLRPTLMFGWFDRKHLGWLSRFMDRVPVFPVPGHGRYMRQPLYAGDFANIIVSCIDRNIRDGIYNISGLERVYYIDIIREIRRVTGAKTIIMPIPSFVFSSLLWVWGLFDKNPPFTTQQLNALVSGDEFEMIEWPEIFGVPYTSFRAALVETFTDARYSGVVLEF